MEDMVEGGWNLEKMTVEAGLHFHSPEKWVSPDSADEKNRKNGIFS